MRVIRICVAFLCVITALGSASTGLAQDGNGPSVNVPLTHFVYDFFERLETKHAIPSDISYRTKPYTRYVICRTIFTLDSLIRFGIVRLNRTESDLLVKLKGEFHFELQDYTYRVADAASEKHLIAWKTRNRENGAYVLGDAIGNQVVEMLRYNTKADSLNSTVSYTTVRGIARGSIGSTLAFYGDFTSTLIKGSDIKLANFQATDRGLINVAGKNVYTFESNAYVTTQIRQIRLQWGKDPIVWGPGRYHNLTLSDNALPFDNLRLDVTFDRVKFSYFHGWLRSDSLPFDDRARKSNVKYFVGHRLEVRALPWLYLAGNETVIYGGRPIQAAYLNPVMIYHIAEQYLGDKDNNTISFDLTALPVHGFKIYSALYVDDYLLSKNPFTFWKQTWAFMIGSFWVEPFSLSNVDLRLDYMRVEPFVYAHKWDLLNYSQYGKSLGADLPPNTDRYSIEVIFRPSYRLDLRCRMDFVRHGEGDIWTFGNDVGFGPGQREKKVFLMGIVEYKTVIGLSGQFEVFKDQYALMNYGFSNITNYGNAKGTTLRQHSVQVGYHLDY